LHLNLLNAATKLNAEIAADPAFAPVYELLAQDAKRQSRNPEVFPPIYDVLLRGIVEDVHGILEKLRLQVDETALDDCRPLNGFTRRTYFAPHLIDHSGENTCVMQDENVLTDIDLERFPLVYFPTEGLFDDIVGHDVYWGMGAPYTRREAHDTLAKASRSLRAYSPEIYDGFCDAIRVLALTGEPVTDVPRSFSARTLYAGGIFSAIKRDNVPAMVENLIHEYYHQRLWLWWMIESPDDLPNQDTTIVSPVTGATKSVQVMLHAFLIYVSVSDYYRYALAHENIPEPSREWVHKRFAVLRANATLLRDRLLGSLDGRPQTKRFVNCVADHISVTV
jgi:hypothetical protein